jgi:ribosome biogenesis GTPase
MKLEDLGYNSFFEKGRNRLELGGFGVARVISESRGSYAIKDGEGEHVGKVTGKQMFSASSREDYPAVGDWVATEKADDENTVIHAVLPRHTILKRKRSDRTREGDRGNVQVIAANVDVAFVVGSVDRDYSPNRFERYFAMAREGGVIPALILNKIDLISKQEIQEKLTELQERLGDIALLPVSTATGEGLAALREYIAKGKTYCFLGSSGVGKSSLINALLGGNTIRTGGIALHSERGTHTTTVRQMHFLEGGGIVIDNPGIREVGLVDAEQGVEESFEDIVALARRCRYPDCTHTREPGCAIIRAVRAGRIDEEKYANYIALRKEASYREMTDAQKREKDRQFGKFLKKMKKGLKDMGHKQ